MTAKDRSNYILEQIIRYGKVDVKSLSEQLDCSEVTIRSDLKKLEELGSVRRTHGGAVLQSHELEISFSMGEYLLNRDEKSRIAYQAYRYINSRDSIIIDDSTTGYYLAQVIRRNPEKRITVITNSLICAAELSNADHVELFVVSGRISGSPPAALDNFTAEAFLNFSASMAFIGASGIDLRKGMVSSIGMAHRDVKKSIIRTSDRIFLLADHNKFGRSSLFSICDIRDVDRIITDSGLPEEMRLEALQMGLPLDCV